MISFTSVYNAVEKIVNIPGCSTPAFKAKPSNITEITVSPKDDFPDYGNYHPFGIDEVVTKLFHMLDLPDIKNLMQVSKKCYSVSDKNIWFEIGRILNVFQIQLNVCPSNSLIDLENVKQLAKNTYIDSRKIAKMCLISSPFFLKFTLHESLEKIVILLLASEKIDDINLLSKICQARDIIVFWDKIAYQVPNQEALRLNDIDSLEKLFSKAAEFQAWCETFQGDLDQIVKLELNYCMLSHLPTQIGNLVNLRSLSVYDNMLRMLPPQIGSLINLEDLIVHDNRLQSLPTEIGNLINLQCFDSSNNKLIVLPDEIGTLSDLQDFNISENQLTVLPNEIGSLGKLTKFQCSCNLLTVLPEEICKLINLQFLYISNNQLNVLPDGISNLNNLLSLTVSSNKLTALPNEIVNLKNLSTLSVCDNQLTVLPEGISNLNNLKFLNVPNNMLTVLPDGISNLNNLKFLNVSNNMLTELPNDIKNWLYVQNRSFDIDGNEISLKERITFFATHYLANYSFFG